MDKAQIQEIQRKAALYDTLLAALVIAEARILEVSVINNVPGIQSQPALRAIRAAIAAAKKGM